jgi:hypothetical protein
MNTSTVAALGVMVLVGGAARAGTTAPAHRCAVDPAQITAALNGSAPVVQLAILLDTSNSMDGLIDQARSQLWTVVNELSGAQRYGRPAELHVALYEYGNNRIASSQGHVRQVLPFTTDLDRVSEELFALTTFGGDEFCGTVIQTALDQLRWSPSPADLKVIFIAGNESFSQGPVSYRKACARARATGIVVNTIHCGPEAEGEQSGWKDGALLAYGAYSTIDQHRKVEHIAAPQDVDLARLGVELNKTYIPFGGQGQAGQMRQQAQDKNAAESGAGSATHRAVTKANRLYSNAGWDLVDAVKNASVDLKTVKAADLPAEMQALSPEQRRAVVEARAREREKLQAEINKLNRERNHYVAQIRRTKSVTDDSLDVVMTQALRAQASCAAIELQ